MNRILLDSNIVIALGKGYLSIEILSGKFFEVSEMTRLEVYGYHRITDIEQRELDRFFQHIRSHTISEEIIDKAIIYRRTKNMSVGDAIIAATAFLQNIPLYTANTDDFTPLTEIQLINPLQNH